ncbi:hypothetical protein Taro_021401 [Colocasia esculenta]|uniref:Uncharacterized protein n=1 Tax=Colocasia esculenta TaxID=4460 RepID=A0A843V169_COLES|nr:hypothetical protein [Colocasia esculenta]
MAGAHHSCPAPSDSTGSSSLPEKGRMIGVDTPLTGVDTMLQTQGKIMQNWSSSVDTRSGSVDTRDLPRKPFVPIWDSVSTLDQVVSTLETFPENLLCQSGTVCRH